MPHSPPLLLQKYGVRLDLPERTNEVTGRYAEACLAAGRDLGVPTLDLWTAFQEVPGWQQGLLDGGLHLTARGNRRVFSLLQQLIAQELPRLRQARCGKFLVLFRHAD